MTDVTVETPEVETQEVEVQETETAVDTEAESEAETVELTVEEKLENLQREAEGKQKKIDRQTAAYRKLQENYEKERQEREVLAQKITAQTPTQEPVIDDFDTHDEYVNALVDYRAKTKLAEQQKEFQAQQENMQQQKIAQERQALRQSQEVEYLAANPMYKASSNEVNAYIQTLESPAATQEAIISQLYEGNVPQVIDYFGSNNGENLDELGNIARMTPPQAAVAMYKIQQKLIAPTKKETKTQPKPVKVKGSTSTGSKPLSQRTAKDVLDWVKS